VPFARDEEGTMKYLGLNDAIQVPSKIPSARLGSGDVRPIVEVRPIRKEFKP